MALISRNYELTTELIRLFVAKIKKSSSSAMESRLKQSFHLKNSNIRLPPSYVSRNADKKQE